MNLSSSPFAARRHKLFTTPGQLFVYTSHDALQMAADQAYRYHQESNFLYLTGITEPGWILIIDTSKDGGEYLIAPAVSDTKQIFNGSLDWDVAKTISGVETIVPLDESDALFQELAKKHQEVFTLAAHPHESYFEFVVNPAQARLTKQLEELFKTVQDSRLLLTKARAIKSSEEVAAIRKAIAISIVGFEKAKAAINEAGYEYDIEAVFNAAFRKDGASGHAYEPIVAAAGNACTLHYIANNAALPKSGLLLIDAGARYEHYAADITRTYAIGTPSSREIEVHGAVETAHQQIIALLKPGLSIKAYYKKVDEIMEAALTTLGLLKQPNDYETYFPHAISHGLGIDVHDSLGSPEVFEEGMVLTVEPGIYIPKENIGVRIEDDILITKTGHENLSKALPTAL